EASFCSAVYYPQLVTGIQNAGPFMAGQAAKSMHRLRHLTQKDGFKFRFQRPGMESLGLFLNFTSATQLSRVASWRSKLKAQVVNISASHWLRRIKPHLETARHF